MDHLSKLPVEILIQIISHLPSTDFLPLVHLSKFFEKFMKTNAKELCNAALTTQPQLSDLSTYFEPTLREGWLIPTVSEHLAEKINATENPTTLTEKELSYICNPGPEYLIFLEYLDEAHENEECRSGTNKSNSGTSGFLAWSCLLKFGIMQRRRGNGPLGRLVWYYRLEGEAGSSVREERAEEELERLE
ncbi:uncharacterized protein PAC_06848 [Phialocephala subalpina]|uniref:F-box domain-containing protein n=1 Tax=Phialocephala subalpina TaxID=576137 RepID=A0A1L7WW23_9HELO|nr:uncharacterized protein PAC_06848 [Phialocephala subalpina]